MTISTYWQEPARIGAGADRAVHRLQTFLRRENSTEGYPRPRDLLSEVVARKRVAWAVRVAAWVALRWFHDLAVFTADGSRQNWLCHSSTSLTAVVGNEIEAPDLPARAASFHRRAPTADKQRPYRLTANGRKRSVGKCILRKQLVCSLEDRGPRLESTDGRGNCTPPSS